MIAYTIIIIALLASGLRWNKEGSLDKALEVSQTNVIKGIFILWVFLLHILPYLERAKYQFDGFGDSLLPIFNIGQLVVVMFMFYSGYGMAYQMRTRPNYIDTIPKHRLLSTLVNFNIAVLCFLVLALFKHMPLSVAKVLLSFIGWKSLGNSNWYIFDIMCLYAFVYVAHKIPSRNPVYNFLYFTLLCVVFTVAMYCLKPFWWYDTVLCFWSGYAFAFIRPFVEPYLKKYWWGFLLGGIVVWRFCDIPRGALSHFAKANIVSEWMVCPWLWVNVGYIGFAIALVFAMYHLRFENPLLQWCGKHLFPIYIYQRIPMMLFPAAFISGYPLVYFYGCLAATLAIAWCYKYWQVKL